MTDGMDNDPVARPMSRGRTYLRLAVSIALLAVAIWLVDPASVTERLIQIPFWAVGAALVLHLAIVVIMALRWHGILIQHDAGFGLRRTIALSFAGAFFNQILPTAMGGDVARAWMARGDDLPLPATVSSVLADRVTGFLGLAVTVFVATLILGDRLNDPTMHALMLAIFPVTVAGFVLLAIPRVPGLVGRWRARLGGDRFARDLRAVLFDRRLFVALLVLAVAGQVLAGAIGFVLAAGMDVALPLSDAVLIFPVIILVTMIPISIAGWGLREGAAAVMLGFVGIDATSAVALSILFGLIQAIAALPGILVWFNDGRRATAARSGP